MPLTQNPYPRTKFSKLTQDFMATSETIRILEATTIAPKGSIADVEFLLPLTFFDTFWFADMPVQALYFYRISDINHEFFDTQILPDLKNSLSCALANFLPLAGNLIWPSPDAAKPIISYAPSDGVSFIVAESNDDFNHLCKDEVREAVKFHPLIPLINSSDDGASIMALQVTLFPSKGFCIGVTTHHTVVDGKSAVMFLKAWAHMCSNSQSSLPSELTPFLDRTVIKDPTGLDIIYLNGRMSLKSPDISDPIRRSLKVSQNLDGVDQNLVRATFRLTRENLTKLRELVLSELGLGGSSSKILHLSSFVLTMAYTITNMVKARDGEKETRVVGIFAADYRKRLDFPVPENYFGNCVGAHVVRGIKDLIDEGGFAFVAKKLSDEIKVLEKGNVLDGAEKKFAQGIKARKEPGVKRVIGIARSPNFRVYESDFGWGRPEKMEVASLDRSGGISLAESRDGSGGIEIGLALEKQEMEKFASLFKDGLGSH